MKVFVGLDCGGSSSRVLAVDHLGVVLYQGHSGAANLASTPETRLRRNLMHASRGCPSPHYVCGCFAGLVNDQVRQRGIQYLREVFPAARLRAEPDFSAAYYASPAETDICIIAGTGSLVCSSNGSGLRKSGGRGFILGDEGSSYHFGRDVVSHYLRDPSDCSDAARTMIQEHFGTLDDTEIIAAVYRSQTPASLLGKLARALALEAQAGKAYAVASLERNTRELVDILVSHIHQFMPERQSLQICLSGGLWKAHPLFREHFVRTVSASLPSTQITVVRTSRPPLYGAVELAKEMVNVD